MTNNDIPKLVRVLRSQSKSPEKRASAALTLGMNDATQETESLVRAFVEDPAPEVKKAAWQALSHLHGDMVDQVLSSYQQAFPYTDSWFFIEDFRSDGAPVGEYDTPLLFNGDHDGTLLAHPDEVDFQGLVSIINGDSPTNLRVKAVHLLQYSTDARAIEWLLLTATEDDEDPVRSAARQILAGLFPDDHEQMLRDFDNDEVEEESLEEEWQSPDEAPDSKKMKERKYYPEQPPAVIYENNAIRLIISFLLVFVAVIVVIYLLLR